MTTATIRSCAGNSGRISDRAEATELVELTRRPWSLLVGHRPMIVRPSRARDLAAVAQMHRRCSARSLLDRYRSGGRPPTVMALDVELRNRFGFVVVTPDGSAVATASIRRDPGHNHVSAEASVLVEDRWQHHGIGSELVAHIAGVAQVAGFHELIGYPATAVAAAQRLMLEVGRTRMVPDVEAHLHTYLTDEASLGLGSVRQQLAG